MNPLLHTLTELHAHPSLPLRDAALSYAAAGLPVFPCVPGGKAPLTHNGFWEATTQPRRIRGWWTWQPEANIGIATGHGIDVLDVDVHGGGDGYPVLERLHRAGMLDGALQSVRTPSGGAHLYFPSDPKHPHQSWSRGKAHVDFRGVGGYIIAPPSRIHDGDEQRRYQTLALGTRPRPVDADTIRDLLTPAPSPRPPRVGMPELAGTERLAAWVATAPEGNRNASLFWAACRLAETGMDETSILDALDTPARSAGLPDREISSTVHSAWRTVQVTPTPAGEQAPFRSGRASVTR